MKESLIERCHRYAAMNPNGFRSPRTKPGRVKHPTLIEKLAAEEYGTPLVKIIPSDKPRKVAKAERRPLYLQQVRATKGLLPKGDTRLKGRRRG